MIIESQIFKNKPPFLEYNVEDVDKIYQECKFFLNNLPEKELKKYNQFLDSKQFNLVLIEFYQKENCNMFEADLKPYTLQFTRVPDSNWQEDQGPYIEEYKKLIDTTVHQYNISDKFFNFTSRLLKKNPNNLKSGILLYKPGVIVPPHCHREGRALGLAYSHTLLHDIDNGHFNFWHSYNYMKLNKQGESFYFDVDEVHYADTNSNAMFLATLCKSRN